MKSIFPDSYISRLPGQIIKSSRRLSGMEIPNTPENLNKHYSGLFGTALFGTHTLKIFGTHTNGTKLSPTPSSLRAKRSNLSEQNQSFRDCRVAALLAMTGLT
jgi:hypothetical protein